MALISRSKSGWRVAYSITTPEKKYQRSKYSQHKSEATELKKQIEILERATKTGLAHVHQIEE
ncbi:MAG: hypothetical protein CME20_01595 [Gemmatimonadetes bacterium]|nr:hypothetical protein [Gemmatimonadota bacterium]